MTVRGRVGALANQAALVTRNTRDFAWVPEL